MKSLKFSIGLLITMIGFNAFAAGNTVVIAAGGMSNLVVSGLSGTLKVTQVSLQSPANNTSSVIVYDTTTNLIHFATPAYSVASSYATNLITTYTNFFGATVLETNLVLVDITTAMPTNVWTAPTVFNLSAATNGNVNYTALSSYFYRGIWATNSGSGNATVTVTYQQ